MCWLLFVVGRLEGLRIEVVVWAVGRFDLLVGRFGLLMFGWF